MKNLLNTLDLNFNNTKNSIKTVSFTILVIALTTVTIANLINPQNFTF